MDSSLKELVWSRARRHCEYCQLSQDLHPIEFEIDHVIARKHGGTTIESNLALSCFSCNSYKGPNIAGIDPDTGQLSRLFQPRINRWDEHFRWFGAILLGKSPIGRATISVLMINHPDHVALREELIAERMFPPASNG